LAYIVLTELLFSQYNSFLQIGILIYIFASYLSTLVPVNVLIISCGIVIIHHLYI